MTVHFELANCEATLLQDIGHKEATLYSVARTYAMAIRSGEARDIDWKKVNAAIIERWSESGLNWIKTNAWSGKCFDDNK